MLTVPLIGWTLFAAGVMWLLNHAARTYLDRHIDAAFDIHTDDAIELGDSGNVEAEFAGIVRRWSA